MKDRKFDALLHMQVAFRANLAAACIPAKLKIGYDKARSKDLHSLFINRRIAPAPHQHVRDCLASFLEPLGGSGPRLPPAGIFRSLTLITNLLMAIWPRTGRTWSSAPPAPAIHCVTGPLNAMLSWPITPLKLMA